MARVILIYYGSHSTLPDPSIHQITPKLLTLFKCSNQKEFIKMKYIKLALAFAFSGFITSTAYAANIYTATCPKCNYEVRLRSGRTKLSPIFIEFIFVKKRTSFFL